MLAALAPSMVRWLAIWDAARGFDAIRTAWLARAGAVGEAMSVNTGTGPVHGTFAGLDMDGALLMRDGHGISRRFDFGDVTLNAGAGRHGQGDGEPEQPT
jgi:BirA family biotin operon repressor/biotin-[acetyl-CoA-carboxylase] ligase